MSVAGNYETIGYGQDGYAETGVFREVEIFKIRLSGGLEVRYRTGRELGYIVGRYQLDLDNPFEPGDTHYEDFYDGLHAGECEIGAAS